MAEAQNHVSPWLAWVERESLLSMFPSLCNTRALVRKPIVVRCPPDSPSQDRVCSGVCWLELHGTNKKRPSLLILFPSDPACESNGANHETPSVDAVGRLTTNPKPLLSVQLGFDSSDYMLRDLVLNCEKVLHLPVVFFGPQMASGFRFDQLSCYADAVSCGSYTSFENVADA